MKTLPIDFAPPSWRRRLLQASWRIWLIFLCGAAALAAAGVTGNRLLEARRVEAVEAQTIAAKRQAQASQRPAPQKIVISEAQATAVNTATAQLNLPWRDLLDALEAATPPEIALLAIEPDGKKQVVNGVAEAKDSNGMVAYVEQLKKQAFFSDVLLTRHETNDQDANKPIRFQFEAHWGRNR
jgi:Tfp pilus assembly protein PilN